jgi:O-antigen biosynthesis protein
VFSERVAFIAVGAGDIEGSIESLQTQTHRDWVAASLPPAEGPFAFRTVDAADFLVGEAADCAVVVFAPAGSRLETNALGRLAQALFESPDALAAYGDLAVLGEDGVAWPLFLPAFDHERQLEQGYAALCFAVRRDVAVRAVTVGASDLYRLFNAAIGGGSHENAIVHVPGVVATLPPFDLAAASLSLAEASFAHLQARGIAATVTPRTGSILPAVHVQRATADGLISIVIPTRNAAEALTRCITSLKPAANAMRAEIVIVDNDSTDPHARSALQRFAAAGHRVLHDAGPMNEARLCNVGVSAASPDREFILFLSDRMETGDGDWLRELMSRLRDGDTGAAAPVTLSPAWTVREAGSVLGPGFATAPAFSDRTAGDPGYGDLLRVAHQQSAATAKCLLVRRTDFLAARGRDAAVSPHLFFDIDLCLKLGAFGRRVVAPPHAQLVDPSPASSPAIAGAEEPRFARELRDLRAKWGEALGDDPCYSPLLSLDPLPYSALARPPRPSAPRLRQPPVARSIPRWV